MDVSENSGTPKSSILTGFSIINHPFWGTPIFGNTHIPTHELHKWFFGCDMLIRRQLPPFIAGVCSRCGNSIRRMFFLFPDGYDFEHARRKHVFFLTFNGDFSEYQTGLLHIFFWWVKLSLGKHLHIYTNNFVHFWDDGVRQKSCDAPSFRTEKAPIYQMNGLLKILKLCRIWKNLRSLKLDLKYMIH